MNELVVLDDIVESYRKPTPAELRCLACAAEGMTDDDAAHFLNRSVHTVRTEVWNALKKLHAHSRTHAVVICMREGWLK